MFCQPDSVSRRLQVAMQARNITATKLAYALGISKSSVSDWLKGGGLNIQNAAAMALELNLSLDWLLLGKGGMDLFGPIHPTADEMLLVRQLRDAGQSAFASFFSMLENLARPALGDDPLSQVVALEMLEKSRMPMVIIGHEGLILDANDSCIEILGDDLDKRRDVLGTHFAAWLAKDDIETAYRHLPEGMNEGHSTNFSCDIRRRSGIGTLLEQTQASVIISAVYHGNAQAGHFHCVLFPTD